jgi:glycerol-3-phosphate acyltransferase PlsY
LILGRGDLASWQAAILAIGGGYLLGSIPFGMILTRLAGAGDLRSIGSGNIGATNVLRTGRKGLAAATLLLDLAKGMAAVLLAKALLPGMETLAAFAVVVGHCFPVWLRFRGGKGVATTMGVAAGLAWPIGLIYAVVWLGLVGLTRISSLGGMSAAIVAPIAAWLLGYPLYIPVLAGIAVLVLWLHRANIVRLRAGTEPRIGGGK